MLRPETDFKILQIWILNLTITRKKTAGIRKRSCNYHLSKDDLREVSKCVWTRKESVNSKQKHKTVWSVTLRVATQFDATLWTVVFKLPRPRHFSSS